MADLDRMNNVKAHINKSNSAIYDTISLLSVRFQLNIHVSFVGPLDGKRKKEVILLIHLQYFLCEYKCSFTSALQKSGSNLIIVQTKKAFQHYCHNAR